MVAAKGDYSVEDALRTKWDKDEAAVNTANGDIIEIIDIVHDKKLKTLTVLFHRASPQAADPDYRKKVGKKVSVRTADRQVGEEQSVSCHLVISTEKRSDGSYDVYLEEIPRISITLINQIIARALNEYKYDFTDNKGKTGETYTVLKSYGVKDETVTNALKGGNFGYITLVRPADASFVDGSEFEALSERMRIRIKSEIDRKEWFKKIGKLAQGARSKGWEDFQIDLNLEEGRKKTVKIERGEEGKEIVFVRSEQISVSKDMPVCSTKVRSDL
ncbi:hypothetical protein I5L01_05085 [Erythrobacter sp. YJ-T3-07]|uniref:hypothetical protein n=1 Tax=Erythrobacter sp. YJ-T3-07 TaxID=2793063 RepID=UPI0018D3DEAB|nr:hypothetical protein [Erythrobacter sp. YJ-T3-07]MBH1943605.1 hypothetical protein [Erythrobacter sp. YJ-T3-07]